jgi:gonadotropin-releasing hormone receptor
MIEMPNSPMIPNNQESSSNMDSDVLITTTVMSTTLSANETMPEDMLFNAGHQLSIIVYRFVTKIIAGPLAFTKFGFYLHSILMVISAIGNITVLVLLIKRRMRTPSRLDIMLTHLAIADLMVS